jgi:hypothetical protein
MRSYAPAIESRLDRAQGGIVNFRNVLSIGVRARMSLAADLSNNSNEELGLSCKN